MMNDFDELYWNLYDEITDNRDNKTDTNSLLASMKELRSQYYNDMIEKDTEFLLYKGYDKQSITDELLNIYKDNVNSRFIINIVNNVVGDDE
jgi:hypothetical protein